MMLSCLKEKLYEKAVLCFHHDLEYSVVNFWFWLQFCQS
jgi:hypothetical protein